MHMLISKALLILKWALLFLILILVGYHLAFWGRIYPGTKVASINLSGKKELEAQEVLKSLKPPQIVLTSDNPKVELPLAFLVSEYDPAKSAKNAYLIGRTGSLKTRTLQKINALTNNLNLPLVAILREDDLEKNIKEAEDLINVPPTEPTIIIEKSGTRINRGQDGIEVDKEDLEKRIKNSITYNQSGIIPISKKITKARLSDQEAELIRERAEKLIGKNLKATVEYQTFTYTAQELVALLAPEGTKEEKVNSVIDDISKTVNRLPQDARLVFEEGKVKEFAPGKDGLETDTKELKTRFMASLENLIVSEEKTGTIEIPVRQTKPQIATGDVNNLGIKELIGRGTSRFAGSIPSRIHNVELAASRINGLLIKPQETFSFNAALGEVSASTGFQQAYVIQSGRTILGDGGGVCQVSTTLFRAGLNAGLPITERRAHSYRVGYYEQDSKPGIDATVYNPTADLKIKNDTLGHILIQAIFNRKNLSLVFELYGTSDGRIATITTPRVWDINPAPPPLYQEDPTLPPNTTKQVDWAALGAKTAFDYKVVRNGEVLQERTFYSNFHPWQAVYLVGPGTSTQ